ncbi:TonB-dependent receptor [Geofilum sp. OHC36d9]|uniref:TonB-dependent receptor n=1 Tax=Geofilum sp. OHC36d9 TaxID=3458413 RepID=UPI004033688D
MLKIANHNYKLFIVLQLLTASVIKTSAQDTTFVVISGIVLDEKQAPLIGGHITSNSGRSSVTDKEGHFTFDTPEQLPVVITISMIGYKKKEITITSKNDVPLTIKMQPQSEVLQQVDVEASGTRSTHNQRLNVEQTNLLPSAAGGGIEGLVQSQMGVSTNNELSSQYRVRGGNFDENLVYVNGQEVYRPFLMHSGQQEGLSFVNPDLVEEVEFSAGGFSSSYGDKMSSVLDIQYKRPQATAGSFSAGILGATAHLEGASRNQKLTWITGVRYKTNRYLLGSLDEKGDYNPNFTDVQTYLTYQLSPRISLELLGYYSLNKYEFIPQDRETTFGTLYEVKQLKIYFEGQEKDRFETGYAAYTTNFKINTTNEIKLTLSGFRTFEEEAYDIDGAYWLQETDDPTGDSDSFTQIGVGEYLQHARNDLLGEIVSASIKGLHQHPKSKTSWSLEYRREFFKDRVNEWEMIDSSDYSIPYNGANLELAYSKNAHHELTNHRINAFIKNEMSWFVGKGRLLADAGVRSTYYSFNDEWLISPRLLLSYLPQNKNSRYRLSGGYYYQPPFFKELRRTDGTLNKDIKSQQSIQIVAGYDLYFDAAQRPFKFTTEVYYKWLKDLIPYQVDNVRIVYSGENEAKGYAAGIDFKINGELVPGEESWATLSLLKTEEDLYNDQWSDPDRSGEPGYIPRPSDQRLNFSMYLQDHLPGNPNFKAHLSFLFGTGLPFGPPRSERYMAINRMPPYRRVDLGLSYDLLKWHALTKKEAKHLKNLWLGIEIFNLPNIDNTVSYYWVTDIFDRQYAVPNYLTSRRINIRLTGKF